jgi:Domain of unknown function (DUF4407)
MSPFKTVANLIQEFFWFCSGANRNILRKPECHLEGGKYVSIGVTIFLTGIFASISGGYAIFTVFRSVKPAVVLGTLWGVTIFNLDRFIVQSIRKEEGNIGRQLLMALPRLVLAIFLSLIVAKPLELKIFHREISYALQQEKIQEALNENSEIQNNSQFREIDELKAKNKQLEQEINQKRQDIDRLYNAFIGEAEGTIGTKIPGKGIVYKEKREEYDRRLSEFEQLKTENNKEIQENNVRIRQLQTIQDQKLEEISAARENADGLIGRLSALERLSERDKTIRYADLAIGILFVIIETAPIFVKLLTKRGAYDAILQSREQEVLSFQEKLDEQLEEELATLFSKQANVQKLIDSTISESFLNALSKAQTNQELTRIQEEAATSILARIQNDLATLVQGTAISDRQIRKAMQRAIEEKLLEIARVEVGEELLKRRIHNFVEEGSEKLKQAIRASEARISRFYKRISREDRHK